jgi:hypothetical protein
MQPASNVSIQRRHIQRHNVAAWMTAALLVLVAFVSASAQPLSDPASGLAITPPPGYVARTVAPTGNYTIAFDVKKPDDKDTGCRVAFQPVPQNASLTQDEINAFTAKPEWPDLVRTTMSRIYVVISLDPFEHAGVRGAVVVGDFKLPPNAPPRAGEIRSWLALLETPKGRTSAACVAEKTSFDARRGEFDAVARGVTLPK